MHQPAGARRVWWRGVAIAGTAIGAAVLAGATVGDRSGVMTSAARECKEFPVRWMLARNAPSDQQLDPPAVTISPSAVDAARPELLPCVIEAGRLLFEARFTRADGVGRPGATGDSKPTIRLAANDPGFLRTSGMDANSCAGCHNQPAVGGSGDFVANVFVGAQFRDPPTTSLEIAGTSERNTVSEFGAGAIELLAREMTRDLWKTRDSAAVLAARTSRDVRTSLRTKGVDFGVLTVRPDGSYDAREIDGVDVDLVVKPFGVKGVVISLREFSINALNHHNGMEATERFGWERTGRKDFDLDGVVDELSTGQITAITIFQAALPAPIVQPEPGMPSQALARGRRSFEAVGCASCHRMSMPLESPMFVEPNPYNRPGNLLPGDAVSTQVTLPLVVGDATSGLYRAADGTVRVAAFTDLKRHRICDAEDPHFCNELLRQDNVPTYLFLTSKLWDAGTSAPYGHRGDCPTLAEAIQHHSGEARASRVAFDRLTHAEKSEVIRFLRSLKAPKGRMGS